MYTLMDLNYIKRDSDGLLFTKHSPEYQEYADYYNAGSPVVAVADTSIYELFEGSLKGKTCGFLKYRGSGLLKRASNLAINKSKARGILISSLCKSVHEYITGKNDASGKTAAEIDAFLVAHGAILTPLSQNRHNSAKLLIDAVTPDQYITQDDLDAVQSMYDAYLPKINAIV